MNLLPRIHARTFYRFLGSGRTKPAIFTCDTDDGTPKQYVVKWYRQLGSRSLNEYIAATIGRHLHIPIPMAAVIDIDSGFAQISPELLSMLGDGGEPHFGSEFRAGGQILFAESYSIPSNLVDTAFDIFAWDMLIQNPDRRIENPNLFIDGEQFTVFDHELALNFELLIGTPPPSWELRGNPLATNHVLYRPLKGVAEENSFTPFLERLADITDTELDELRASIPAEWDKPTVVTKIIEHIILVRDNIDRFQHGLLEVMT